MPTFGAGSSCRAAGRGRDEAGSSGAGSGARPGSRPLRLGAKGHRIVADIAQERLTEVTKRNVQLLIGNNTLASVANWADQIRPERDETYNWHFVDIPKDAQGFSDPRDCYRPEDTHKGAKDDHQNCVVDRIEYFKRVLGACCRARLRQRPRRRVRPRPGSEGETSRCGGDD